MRDYKRRIDHNELPIEIVDELESPIVITGGELDNGELTQAIQVDFRNNTMQVKQVKKLSKADKKRQQRAKKKAEEKQKAKEKRELQRIRKEFEDR